MIRKWVVLNHTTWKDKYQISIFAFKCVMCGVEYMDVQMYVCVYVGVWMSVGVGMCMSVCVCGGEGECVCILYVHMC